MRHAPRTTGPCRLSTEVGRIQDVKGTSRGHVRPDQCHVAQRLGVLGIGLLGHQPGPGGAQGIRLSRASVTRPTAARAATAHHDIAKGRKALAHSRPLPPAMSEIDARPSFPEFPDIPGL